MRTGGGRWCGIAVVAATVAVTTLSIVVVTFAGSGDPSADGKVSAAANAPRGVTDASDPRWPTSIANRKVLDQHGDVYLIRSFSSWGMAFNLSDAEISTALGDVAANGFNGVTVWMGGGAYYGEDWTPTYQQKATGQAFWTGTPWASGLGPAWASLDHLVAEAQRLGVFVWMSLNAGIGVPRADFVAVTDADMYHAGAAVAARYRTAPNVGWHVMIDDKSVTTDGTVGQRIDAFFHGVNDTEGASTRPVRWMENGGGNSTNEQGWLGATSFNPTINTWYEFGGNSTEIAETAYAEVPTVPVGDCEPPYDGSPHYGQGAGQQLRERGYATFLEGGSLINYGHEDWWPFGLSGLYSEGLTWEQVRGDSHTKQQSYAWTLLDQFVANPAWAPDDGAFLSTGTGNGDTKAAAGRSDTAALAYFPSAREVVVNTTVLAGNEPVRLRWYDPTAGMYIEVSASEAQQAERAVSYPSPHLDGSNDWTLVVDLASGTTTTTTPPSTTTTTTGPPSTTTTTTTSPPTSTTLSATTTPAAPSTTTTQGGAGADPAFVQQAAERVSSGASNSVSFADGNRSGDLIVVYVLWSNTGNVVVSDTNGNTYVAAGTPTTWKGGLARSAVFYAANIAAGPNTVTATFAAPITTFGLVYAHEYANVATINPLDGMSSATGATTAVSSSPLTTMTDGDLLFVAAASTAKVQLTDPAYTTRSDFWDNVTGDASGQPAGAHTVTGTDNGTAWVVNLVAFRPATTTEPTTTMESTTTTTPQSSVPSAPRRFTATGADKAAKLIWLAPLSDGGEAITDYIVQRSADGARTWTTIYDGVSTASTTTIGGLTNGQRYWFRVAAVNRVGRGAWSTTRSAVPHVPSPLTATRATTPPSTPDRRS